MRGFRVFSLILPSTLALAILVVVAIAQVAVFFINPKVGDFVRAVMIIGSVFCLCVGVKIQEKAFKAENEDYVWPFIAVVFSILSLCSILGAISDHLTRFAQFINMVVCVLFLLNQIDSAFSLEIAQDAEEDW